MTVLVIVLVLVLVVLLIAALAFNPIIAKSSQRAVDQVRTHLGEDRIKVLDSRAVAFGTEPDTPAGLRGQGCLAVNDTELMFVTTAGQNEFVLARSRIKRVDTSGDPRSGAKATVSVIYDDPEDGEVKASWRLANSPDWLDELGYDWGTEGPPAKESDTAD
jgi:hypothetical protein